MNTVELMNNLGRIFADNCLAMFWQSSVLIVLLFAADILLKRRVRAVVRYGLWLLVMLKLVLPVGIAAPWSPFYWLEDGEKTVTQEAPAVVAEAVGGVAAKPEEKTIYMPSENVPVSIANNVRPYSQPQLSENIRPVEVVVEPEKAVPAVSEEPTEPVAIGPELGIWAWLLVGWSVVVLVLLAMLLQRYWFVRSLVAQAAPADDRSYEILLRAKNRLGFVGRVRLGLSANSLSPSVCGLTRPVILIPADMTDKLDDGQLEAVLLHELAHVRRGDLWVNLFQTLLQIAYFWHPLVWFANGRIRSIREQAVDEAVLVAMADGADAYPETLLHVSKLAWSRPMLSLRLIGVVESKSALAGRIRHILSRPIPGTARLGKKALLTIILAAAIILPMAKGAVGEPEFVIKGKVVDSVTGDPIANVRVGDVDDYNKGIFSALTDEKGEYSYKTWYEEHGIYVKAVGYKTAEEILLTKTFGSETEKVIDFKLVLDLPEIELSTHKYVKTGSVVSFVLKHKGGSIESTEIKSPVCPNIVIILDGQKCQTNMGSSPYSDGSFVTLTNNSFVAGDKRELSVGKHTVQAEYEPHTFTINGKTVEVSELKSNVVKFEVVESLPDDYLQPKHYENAKQILDECSVKVLFDFEDITENLESLWDIKGYTPPFNIAAKVSLESESGKKMYIADLLVVGNAGQVVKNNTFSHISFDGNGKNLEILTGNWFVTEKWRVVLEPSQDVAMKNPAIKSYCDDVYYGPYENIQLPLDGSWLYGSGIDTRSEFSLANTELLKSEYIDLDNVQYLKQSTDAELKYEKQSSSLVPVSDNGVWAVKLATTYSLKNLVEQVKQAILDGNTGNNIVSAIPAGADLFDMYVVRTDTGANYILVVNTVKDNHQGMIYGNELSLLTISDEIINEVKGLAEPVEFPNGVVARIVAVGRDTGKGKQWWSPAGYYYDKLPYDLKDSSEDQVLVWFDAVSNDDKVKVSVSSASVSSGDWVYKDGLTEWRMKLYTLSQSKELDKFDLKFALSSDNWETLAECGPDGNTGDFSAVTESTDPKNPRVIISASVPAGAGSENFRLAVVDSKGHIYSAQGRKGGQGKVTGEFGIARDEVAGFKLQKRQYVWQTIKDIPLTPGENWQTKPYVEPVPIPAPRGKFIAKRYDGLEVELMGVANFGEEYTWWQADGSEIKQTYWDRATYRLDKKGKKFVLRVGNGGNADIKSPEIVGINYDFDGKEKANMELNWWGVGFVYRGSQTLGNMVAHSTSILKNVDIADLEVKVRYENTFGTETEETFVFKNVSLKPGKVTEVEVGVESGPLAKAAAGENGLKDKLKGYVREFFKQNFRDITARKDIEWSQPVVSDDGNITIRYKYEATIWDKDKVINNQEFTYTAEGKFVKIKNVVDAGDADSIKSLVSKFFSQNFRDITARKDIEWGQPVVGDDGNITIRYKYEATIRDKEKVIKNQEFTFTADGEYIGYKDVEIATDAVPAADSFKADLDDGTTVELLGIRNWKTGECFAIDGSKIEPFGFSADWTPQDDKDYEANDYYEVVMALKGDVEDLGLIHWNMNNMKYSSSANIKPSLFEDGIHVGTVVMPVGLAQSDLAIGIAVEPWRTILSGDYLGYYSDDKYTVNIDYVNQQDILGGLPIGKGSHAIKVMYNATDCQFRIIAIDKNGDTHYSASSGSGGTDQMRSTVAYFEGLDADNVKEYQFQVREYKWINVKNVSLKPGKVTEVGVGTSSTTSVDDNYEAELRDAMGKIRDDYYLKYDDNVVNKLNEDPERAIRLMFKILQGETGVLKVRAASALVVLWDKLSVEQMDLFLKLTMAAKIDLRTRYPQGMDVGPGMWYENICGSNGWPEGLEIHTVSRKFLDDKQVDRITARDSWYSGLGRVSVKGLSIGSHSVRLITEYTAEYKGHEFTGVADSVSVKFEMISSDSPNELAAPNSKEVEEVVNASLTFKEICREEFKGGFDPIVYDAWEPHDYVRKRNSHDIVALHTPYFSLEKPLDVDLCFDVKIVVLESGKEIPCNSIVIEKGGVVDNLLVYMDDYNRLSYDSLSELDDGFVPVRIVLTPSYAEALDHTGVSSYYDQEVISPVLRMKVFKFTMENAKPWERELAEMYDKLENRDKIDSKILHYMQEASSLSLYQRAQSGWSVMNPHSEFSYSASLWDNENLKYASPFLVKYLYAASWDSEDYSQRMLVFKAYSAASEALIHIGQYAIPALLAELEVCEDNEVVPSILYVLVSIAGQEAIDPLKGIVNKVDPVVRVTIENTIRKLEEKKQAGIVDISSQDKYDITVIFNKYSQAVKNKDLELLKSMSYTDNPQYQGNLEEYLGFVISNSDESKSEVVDVFEDIDGNFSISFLYTFDDPTYGEVWMPSEGYAIKIDGEWKIFYPENLLYDQKKMRSASPETIEQDTIERNTHIWGKADGQELEKLYREAVKTQLSLLAAARLAQERGWMKLMPGFSVDDLQKSMDMIRKSTPQELKAMMISGKGLTFEVPEKSGEVEKAEVVSAKPEDIIIKTTGRKVVVPKWPKIEISAGVYSGFGSFSTRVWDDRVGWMLSGAWDDLSLNGQQLVVPDGYALKLNIYTSNNTDLSALSAFGPDDIQVLALPSVNMIDSRAMPNIGKLTGLVALYLGGADIRDKDLANLANLKELKCLSLQDCTISDDSIGTLVKMTSLRELNLWGTAVTQNGYKQLLKKLPNCSVWWGESQRKDNRLIGKWNSEKFSGLCAGDFEYEAFIFNKDGTYQEQVIYTDSEQAVSSQGKYHIEKDKIIFDDGQSVPYEFDGDKLVISRKANIGRVKVTFANVARDSGIRLTAVPRKQVWDISKEVPTIDVQVSIEDEAKYKANYLDNMKFSHGIGAFVMYVDGLKYYPTFRVFESDNLSDTWQLEITLDNNWQLPINAGEHLGPDNNKELIWSPGEHRVKLVFIGKDMHAGRKWFTTYPAGVIPPEAEFKFEIIKN